MTIDHADREVMPCARGQYLPGGDGNRVFILLVDGETGTQFLIDTVRVGFQNDGPFFKSGQAAVSLAEDAA